MDKELGVIFEKGEAALQCYVSIPAPVFFV
jgi:hypothetical protein